MQKTNISLSKTLEICSHLDVHWKHNERKPGKHQNHNDIFYPSTMEQFASIEHDIQECLSKRQCRSRLLHPMHIQWLWHRLQLFIWERKRISTNGTFSYRNSIFSTFHVPMALAYTHPHTMQHGSYRFIHCSSCSFASLAVWFRCAAANIGVCLIDFETRL